MRRTKGLGNAISNLSPSRPRRISIAACSALIRFGISKLFLSVSVLLTKPGLINCRVTKLSCSSARRLSHSETIPEGPAEWLGEDYGFCWMVRQVGGTVRSHISKTIGHEVPSMKYFYPETYKSKQWGPKSIVYYTGPSRLAWSTESLKTGIREVKTE